MANTLNLVFKTAVTDSSTTAQEQLGVVRVELDSNGGYKKYKYVQNHASSAALANGTPAMYVLDATDTNLNVVTTVVATGGRNLVAGVAVGAIAAGSYGWLQIYGRHSAVLTNGDDDIAALDAVIQSSTAAVVDSVAAGTAPTHAVLGWALAADVDGSNTVSTFITIGE